MNTRKVVVLTVAEGTMAHSGHEAHRHALSPGHVRAPSGSVLGSGGDVARTESVRRVDLAYRGAHGVISAQTFE
jgi:hypothetical protein